MSRYWSNSKFADFVRGTKRPQTGVYDIVGSDEWEATAKQKPVRYWLAENGLDYLQTFVTSPMKLYDAIKAYMVNRWKNKTHGLTSTLQPGQYHDLDERIVYSVFDSLVDMIENELFLINTDYWDRKSKRKMRHNKQARMEAGLACLSWWSTLTYGKEGDRVEKDDPNFGKLTTQAIAAKEMIALYFWWKFERPHRIDPMDATGLTDIYEKYLGILMPEMPDNERQCYDIALKNTHDIEAQYKQEDEDMLIRLMKIRRHLWV